MTRFLKEYGSFVIIFSILAAILTGFTVIIRASLINNHSNFKIAAVIIASINLSESGKEIRPAPTKNDDYLSQAKKIVNGSSVYIDDLVLQQYQKIINNKLLNNQKYEF